jgi:hypothetical protein
VCGGSTSWVSTSWRIFWRPGGGASALQPSGSTAAWMSAIGRSRAGSRPSTMEPSPRSEGRPARRRQRDDCPARGARGGQARGAPQPPPVCPAPPGPRGVELPARERAAGDERGVPVQHPPRGCCDGRRVARATPARASTGGSARLDVAGSRAAYLRRHGPPGVLPRREHCGFDVIPRDPSRLAHAASRDHASVAKGGWYVATSRYTAATPIALLQACPRGSPSTLTLDG